MVKQGCELQLPVLPCRFAHTLQPAWPALPARCPARVRLWRVLLGPRPSLRNLRRRLPALVRLLRRYYAVVRLPLAVHEGLAAHRVLPPARRVFSTGSHGVSRFSRMEFLRMPGVFDSAGPSAVSRWRPPPCCLPHRSDRRRHPESAGFRSSIPCLRIPLSNASSAASRPPSQGWGPGWLATPSLYDSFIRDSMPVYPGAIRSVRPDLLPRTDSRSSSAPPGSALPASLNRSQTPSWENDRRCY